MKEKFERFCDWWIVIWLTILLGVFSLFLVVGPLLLGLLVNPYFFLFYIITVVFSAPIGYIWCLIPDLITYF